MRHHVDKPKKLGRPVAARRALYKGLLVSVIDKSEIETSLAKAKGLRPQLERLVTYAKKGDLASFRRLVSAIGDKVLAHKLIKEIAPKFATRNGGYLSIKRTRIRPGDATQMAKIGWVVDVRSKKEDVKEGSVKIPKTPKKPKEAVIKEKVTSKKKTVKKTIKKK